MLGQIIHALVAAIAGLVGLVLFALSWVEGQFATAMNAGGVPPQLQVVLEVVLAVLFLVAAIQLFGGILRTLLVVLLVAFVLHAVIYHGHPSAPPATFHT